MTYYDEQAASQATTRGYRPRLERRSASLPLTEVEGPTDWESLRSKGYAATIVLKHHGQPARGWAVVNAKQVSNLVKNQTHPACPYEVLAWHVFPVKFHPTS